MLGERQFRVRRLPERLAACFHPDATVTTSWMAGSAAEFISASGARTTDTHRLINRVGAPVVHLRAPRAVVELPSTTTRWLLVGDAEAELASHMRLLYRIERRAGAWKIDDLSAINEGDSLTSVIASEPLAIDRELLSRFRHSYRFLAYTRALNGEIVSDDLYGVDQPGPVDELYARAFAWLQGPAGAQGTGRR